MQNNVEIIQINISGEDKPGMTSSLTEILARYNAFILDIGQANIHQSLTLGILIKTTSDKSGNIMKELLFKATELGVMIRFTPISEEKYNDWVGRQGKNRYILTLLGRTVTARHIAEVTKVVTQHGLNIDAIKRLTGRMPLKEDNRAAKSCIELSVRGSLSDQERSAMHEAFIQATQPKAFIIPVWGINQPTSAVMQRMLDTSLYPGDRMIFATGRLANNDTALGDYADDIRTTGHIVVRVYEGGSEYQIFVLSDTTTAYQVVYKTDILQAE